MERVDRATPQPCRFELLQIALEGASWPSMSIENLLDRLTAPSEREVDLARNHSTTKGTLR